MPNIDESAQAGLNAVLTGVKTSADLLTLIFQKLSEKMEESKRSGKPFVEQPSTTNGKQNLKSLIAKHQQGVVPLQDNLSREELKSFQKEFKDMGVDFSVRKIGKDSYSVFFAGKDSETIEKAISNAIEKRSKKIEKLQKRSEKKEVKKDLKKGNISTEQLKIRQKEIDQKYRKDKPKEHKQSKSL
ncbi:DUF3801 domain-containing protein [Erysipelothrix rhusiopathiae]|nr:DUF3801 domain-containing protein [Erysipelothrix rhusiopathiae]